MSSKLGYFDKISSLETPLLILETTPWPVKALDPPLGRSIYEWAFSEVTSGVLPNLRSFHENVNFNLYRLPVHVTVFISMFLEHHDVDQVVYDFLNAVLRHSAESGVHGQCLSAGHLVNEGVKLRTVAQVLLDL